MKLSQPFLAAAMLGLGLLQAWDAHAFAHGQRLASLILVAIVTPPLLVLFGPDRKLHATALAVSLLALVAVRAASAEPLRELALAAIFQAMVWLVTVAAENRPTARPSA